MITPNLKKKAVLFASILSLSCFAYLNLFVNTEVQDLGYQVEVGQEESSTTEIITPDLEVVSQFIKVGKKVLKSLH